MDGGRSMFASEELSWLKELTPVSILVVPLSPSNSSSLPMLSVDVEDKRLTKRIIMKRDHCELVLTSS